MILPPLMAHEGFFCSWAVPSWWLEYEHRGFNSEGLADAELEVSTMGDTPFHHDGLYLRKVHRAKGHCKVVGFLPLTKDDLLPLAQGIRSKFGYDLFPVFKGD